MHRRAENLPLVNLLYEGNDPEIRWIRALRQGQTDVSAEDASLFEATNLFKSLENGHVRQMTAGILSPRNIGLRPVKRQRKEHLTFAGSCIRLYMGSQLTLVYGN